MICTSSDVIINDNITFTRVEHNLRINPKEYAIRLNQACDINHIPAKNQGRGALLAKMMNVTPRTTSGWLEGEFMPTRKKRAILHEKLNVSRIYMEFGEGEIRPSVANNVTGTLPIVNLQDTNKITSEMLSNQIKKTISIEGGTSSSSFITYQDDDSMHPVFPNNSLLIVDPEEVPRRGSFVLAWLDIESKCIIRQFDSLTSDDSRFFLIAMNKKHVTHELNDNIKVIGVVVYSLSDRR